MQTLITDILAFSKISNESDDLVECDLNLIVGDVLKDLENRIEEKNASIEVEKLPVLPGNQSLLRSLFMNLIENAIKYCRQDVAPHIFIRNLAKPEKGNRPEFQEAKYCRIQVEDNGIGFEQKYAEHIFSMFRRLHNMHEFEGTGIGLAICRKIVEKHNGFISAQSTIDKGSTFTISLPLKLKEPVLATNN